MRRRAVACILLLALSLAAVPSTAQQPSATSSSITPDPPARDADIGQPIWIGCDAGIAQDEVHGRTIALAGC